MGAWVRLCVVDDVQRQRFSRTRKARYSPGTAFRPERRLRERHMEGATSPFCGGCCRVVIAYRAAACRRAEAVRDQGAFWTPCASSRLIARTLAGRDLQRSRYASIAALSGKA